MNEEQFVALLAEKGFNLSPKQQKQFAIYYENLVEWNEKINLTAVTARDEVYLKHFYDSISAAFYYDFSQVETLCDVGAGAGFPSIPLKILFPHIKLTIVDSLNKRINFLNHLAAELEIEQVQFVHDRAETFGRHNQREHFDVVTARAVARLSVLSELCLPLVKKGGDFVALKGAQTASEIEDAEFAVQLLGGKIKEVHNFKLPVEDSERAIVVIEKVRQTPKKYPRKPGTPNKEPLMK